MKIYTSKLWINARRWKTAPETEKKNYSQYPNIHMYPKKIFQIMYQKFKNHHKFERNHFFVPLSISLYKQEARSVIYLYLGLSIGDRFFLVFFLLDRITKILDQPEVAKLLCGPNSEELPLTFRAIFPKTVIFGRQG